MGIGRHVYVPADSSVRRRLKRNRVMSRTHTGRGGRRSGGLKFALPAAIRNSDFWFANWPSQTLTQ